MGTEEILAVGRIVERLLVVGFGGLSIYLGWHLFTHTVSPMQSAEFESSTFSFKLTRVGPGTFFVLFGSYILTSIVGSVYSDSDLKVELPPGTSVGDGSASDPNTASPSLSGVLTKRQTSLHGGSLSEVKGFEAINTLETIADRTSTKNKVLVLNDLDQKKIRLSAFHLIQLRNTAARNYFGKEKMDRYNKLKGIPEDALEAEDLQLVNEVDVILKNTLNIDG